MNNHVVIEPGSALWISGITITISAMVLLFLLARTGGDSVREWIAKLFGIALLGAAVLIHPYLAAIGKWSVQDSLPLHMCTLSVLLCGTALLTRNQLAFEMGTYWGITGGLHSLLTPEFTHGIDPVLTIDYYLAHGGIVFSGLFLIAFLGMRLRKGSWWKVFLYTQLLLPFIFIINLLAGSNYMFLNHPPVADNPFIVGDWPWYLLILEAIALAHFFQLYYTVKYAPAVGRWLARRAAGVAALSGSILKLAAFLLLNLIQLPLTAITSLLFYWKIRRHMVRTDPVFILGHWRSGTTKMHGLLTERTDVGYLSFYQAIFPGHFLLTEPVLKPVLARLTRLLNINMPYFNRIGLNWDFPCEEDTALLSEGSSASAYWGYVFPKRAGHLFERTMFLRGAYRLKWMRRYHRFIAKISYANRGKRLVLKSPPNTTRVKELLELFPKASFIYLHRDPCEVFYSHKKLWNDNLRMFGLQQADEAELNRLVLELFNRMTDDIEYTRGLVPSDRFISVAYHDLMHHPESVLGEIREKFSLKEVPQPEPVSRSDYEPFRYAMDAVLCEDIRQYTSVYRKRYGY